ncbi:hypothetical protein ACFSL4_35155 [Streptomyces caeni]|uniref:Uncharacterized protein n=1 Tax=Streptomyces caeni TaxID=2307231 RepID=A0ABW4J3F4_9ACTN
MTTDTATAGTTTTPHGARRPLRLRPAGRHRKPRPRRLVLAVGGFALVSGALGLVHLASPPVTGGSGTAEAEPRIGATTGSTAPASVPAVPSAGARGHSAVPGTAAGGGPRAATATVRPLAQPSSAAPRTSDAATGIPDAPSDPTASRIPRSPTATAPPAGSPAPSSSTTTVPAPDQDPPGLCIPIVGLCVNGLVAPGG